MRIGSSLILQNGLAYQSYEWSILRPLGNLQRAINALDEYQCDEIAIILPLRGEQSLSSMDTDLSILRNVVTFSPLSIGGGIRSIEDLECIADLPVERVIISSAIINQNWQLFDELQKRFGAQAIQSILPIREIDSELFVYNSIDREFIPFSTLDLGIIQKISNEIIIYDTQADGLSNCFSFEKLKNLKLDYSKTLITGGVGENSINTAHDIGLAGCIVDNRVLHREDTINAYKRKNRLS